LLILKNLEVELKSFKIINQKEQNVFDTYQQKRGAIIAAKKEERG